MNTIPDTAIVSTLANLGGQFTEPSDIVWCDTFEQTAYTNVDDWGTGFCQYCGATDHTQVAR